LEEEQLLQETRQAIILQSFDIASELATRFTDLRIQQISDQLMALEFARDRDLEQAGDNERAKLEINKRFDEERKKLQRQQANTEKANSLFQIAINTATGITKTIAQLGLPAAIPFVALSAALGAAQAAAVIAAPLPQFDEGTERTPKDYIAGEKRPEFRKSKGKWSIIEKPTLFKNSAGDKIVSGKETDSILGTISDITGNNLLSDKGAILSLLNNDIIPEKRKTDNLAYILKRNNEKLIDTIRNKKEVSIVSKGGRQDVKEYHKGRLVNRIDKYYRR
jgi:hypothetical protein